MLTFPECSTWLVLFTLMLYPLLVALYNLTLHPLAAFPGPTLWRSTRLAYMFSLWSGRSHHHFKGLHDRFGPVVRVAPNELSFADPAAWRDIYSNQFPKSAVWHAAQSGRADAIINCLGREEHARMKKLLEPGFTKEAVERQESIVRGYADVFVQNLREKLRYMEEVGRSGATVDVARWFTFLSLDIIGDLTFGEGFGCLRQEKMDEWVSILVGSLQAHVFVATLRHYRWVALLMEHFVLRRVMKKADKHWRAVKERVNRRLTRYTTRPDFVGLWQKTDKCSEDRLSVEETYANALIMTFAGSETVATSLSGTTNLLVKYPEKLAALTEEVRSNFENEGDMTFASLEKLPYLNAVLREGFRMCTLFPLGFVRITPPAGGMVCGHWIPGNTFVSINLQTLSLGHGRFYDATSFIPERWLPKARRDVSSPFYNDARASVRPFGVGPRSCIGQRLALAEMRLIMARLIWTFDVKRANTAAGSLIWQDQRTFTLVERQHFEVQLTPARAIEKSGVEGTKTTGCSQEEASRG